MRTELITEERLILLLLKENREVAIREIHAQYGEYLTLVANSILRNEQDTEECVNDVLLQLWSKTLPEDITSFKAYITKIFGTGSSARQ